jgi:hypothetical protein
VEAVMRQLVCTVGALVCLVQPVAAQSVQPSKGRNLLSVNPLGIPFLLLTGEYERAASDRFSIGVAGNYYGGWSSSNDDWLSTDLKLRFYPNEEVLRGFSIGLAGGLMRRSGVRTVSCSSTGCIDESISDFYPAVAVIADYNAYLGRRRDFLVGLGFGAKRALGNDNDFFDITVIPSVRFQLGLRF